MSKMNEGISILIDRMRTHPEDFPTTGNVYSISGGSWRSVAEYAATAAVFTEEERAAVTAALDEVTRKNFTARILELLAAPSRDEMEEKMRQEMGQYRIVQSNVTNNVLTNGGIQQALQNEYTSGLYNNYQAAQQQAKFK